MAVGQAPGRGDGRVHRLLMWLGHYSTHFMLLAAGTAGVYYLAGQVPAALGWFTAAAWAVAIAAALADVKTHFWCLCERCVRAAPVLDPEGAVTRWRLALRYCHLRLLNILLPAVSLGLMLSVSAWCRGYPSDVAAFLYVLVLCSVFITSHQHQRLRPWCPWCHWGDGGEEEVSPGLPQEPAAR